MDTKIKAKIEAGLIAAEAMFAEVENPTMNMRDQYGFFKSQVKLSRAALKALKTVD